MAIRAAWAMDIAERARRLRYHQGDPTGEKLTRHHIKNLGDDSGTGRADSGHQVGGFMRAAVPRVSWRRSRSPIEGIAPLSEFVPASHCCRLGGARGQVELADGRGGVEWHAQAGVDPVDGHLAVAK